MKNKVLIRLIVPDIDSDFDIFIPVNEIIWKIKKMALKCVNDLSKSNFDLDKEYVLLNKTTSRIYTNNEVVIDTDIRNGTELLIIKK